MPNLDSLANMADEPIQDPNSGVLASLPPAVRDYILSHPSYAEGEKPSSSTAWPYSYRGQLLEMDRPHGAPRDQALMDQMYNNVLRAPSRGQDINYTPGGTMPWPNLTPQELAAYQQMLGIPGGQMSVPGGAQGGMSPQMQAYQAWMQMQQRPGGAGQLPGPTANLGGQPSMANMLAGPMTGANMVPTTGAGWTPPQTSNLSTILNNPQLMQLIMRQYGGGAGM